jgi:hypothetical protein
METADYRIDIIVHCQAYGRVNILGQYSGTGGLYQGHMGIYETAVTQ